MAFAIDALRRTLAARQVPDPSLRALLVDGLASLIQAAMRPSGGDAAFQALVLKAQSRAVQEHVQLAATALADRKAVSAAVGAIAHPGKLASRPDDAMCAALAPLHRLACSGEWDALKRTAGRLLDQPLDAEDRLRLQALREHAGLERLARCAALAASDAVARYQALCKQRGPLSGSSEAAARGAAAGHRGAATEARTVQALDAMAALLNREAPRGTDYRVVSRLLVPAGFPGSAERAKSEWDAAIVRQAAEAPAAEVVLLAEAKASPEAAAADLSRLLRGLQRLSQVPPADVFLFPSDGAAVHLTGESLRQLAPHEHSLPKQVIYCCDAPLEPSVPLLGAAARGALLAEPASVDFAVRLANHEAPVAERLHPVWTRLVEDAQLKWILHQDENARTAREAMLHPEDVLEAVAAAGQDG